MTNPKLFDPRVSDSLELVHVTFLLLFTGIN